MARVGDPATLIDFSRSVKLTIAWPFRLHVDVYNEKKCIFTSN